MSSKTYYISRSPGKTEGPFTKEELFGIKLPSHTQIFSQEVNDWQSIKDYPDLLTGESAFESELNVNMTDLERKVELATAIGNKKLDDVEQHPELNTPKIEQPVQQVDTESDVWDSQEWQEAQNRRRGARIGLLLCIAAALFSAFSSWHAISVLERLRKQNFIDDEMQRILDRSDTLEVISGFGNLVAFIFSAILFVRWFQYMYRNLYERVELPWSKSAGAWSWFIPIVNYYRPVQIANKMVESSEDDEDAKGMVGAWWAFWVLGLFVSRFGPDWSGHEAANISELIHQSRWSIVSLVFTIISALTAIGAVNAISEASESWPAKPEDAPNPS